jgi:capsular polysaccharide biosynthesis protein
LLSKCEVSTAINGKANPNHPLIVVELAGGKIIGDLRLAVTCDDVVIGSIQTVAGSNDLPNHYTLHRRRFRIPQYRRGKALLLGGAASDNYYHWLVESLPRWKMMLAANHFEYDFVLLHSKPSNFQNEMLDRLNVSPEKRLRCSKNFIHQFERLVVPALPAPQWQATSWACEWVRSLLPEHRGGPEKIYVTRRDARRRKLVNELELETSLLSLGFAIVQPEKLTVIEQARLFGSAKCIVAAHGAGLSNLMFAPVDSLLVELFHPDIPNPAYKNLTATCQIRYRSLIGQRMDHLPPTDERWATFKIDVPEVLRILAENA